MELKDYNLIQAVCRKHIVNLLHDRHLEDCVQYVCLRWLERPQGINIKWCIWDYCRDNGIGKRGKSGARALEFSLSLDAPSGESDDSYYLIDEKSILVSQPKDTVSGVLEEFLAPLDINKETLEWAIKTYQQTLSSSKLNSLMKNSN